ncbi:MAG TPA: PEGA domain-containing protein [Polyangia bacterium]
MYPLARPVSFFSRFGLLATVVLCLSTPAPANAQPTPANEADRLIEQALDLRGAGKDREALPLLERAHQLAPTPRAAAQRGFVLQALGSWVRAESDLRRALAAADDPWIRQQRALLEESLTFVQARLGSLEIETNVRDAEVSVDGSVAGRAPLPTPVRLALGRHTVEVRAPGFAPASRSVEVTAQSPARLHLPLTALPAPAALIPPAPAETSAAAPLQVSESNSAAAPAPIYRRWYFWAGVAAVAATAVTIGIVASSSSPFACGANGRICAR